MFAGHVGVGWSPHLVWRGRRTSNNFGVLHRLYFEGELVPRSGNQPYPFRAEDFSDNWGMYLRLGYQLGSLGPRKEPRGFVSTVGINLYYY